MKNLLALIGLVVVLVLGLGWYLGWYKLTTETGHVKVDFDTKEIRDDLKKGREVINNIIDKNVEGKTTSRSIDPNVSITLPSLPALPDVPKGVKLEFNKDGSLIPAAIERPKEFQGK